jgi:hypothetical protein
LTAAVILESQIAISSLDSFRQRDPQLSQPILDIVARIYRKIAGSEEESEDHDQQADIHHLSQQFPDPSSVFLRERGSNIKVLLRISPSRPETRELFLNFLVN